VTRSSAKCRRITSRVTIEKAAVNAVMAGCRPEYLPVLLAALEYACDPNFNQHGMSASTHFAAPLMVVNGPIRTRIGMNAGFGVFGPGYRANATLGRARRLLMINVGGAKPGETSMSTFGHPDRYTYCVAENEEASPWPPYHASRGFPEGSSAVTLFTSRSIRTPCSSSVPNTHARSRTTAGLRRTSHDICTRRCGVPTASCCRTRPTARARISSFAKTPPATDAMVPKFPSPDKIHVVVAGGTAGRFSVAIPGWLGTRKGSPRITRIVETG
jgi:hypothetical protein